MCPFSTILKYPTTYPQGSIPKMKKVKLLLRGEIAALDHYRLPGGKTRGQGQHFSTSQEELPSLTYFITTTQVVK
jgi:hypothetical protein